MNDADEEIVREFLEESRENLDQLDRGLVELEGRPTDPELLAQVFRTIHTIKGTCGFLGYRHLERLAHAGENLLSALRDGDLVLDTAITSSLLHLVDAVRGELGRIDATGSDGAGDHTAVIAAIERHLARETTEATTHVARDAEAIAAPVETTVRVDVAVLDTLMDLVGELVLARSQIGELTDDDDEGPLAAPYRKLRVVTSELRDGVMRARLQPIGHATGKLRRVVRDLAAELGKQIRVEIEGEDVGVDKAMNEAIRDPLLHLVRNAVDHGIEMPDARVRAGKPPEGLVKIRAFHEGGRVVVELSDDGRGIDADQLVAHAISNGMLTAASAASLTPSEARDLMFRPGLSTKDDVTNVSGRGVGMDVVHANLEQVDGTIHVDSELGRGTLVRISLPLTRAVVPMLIVRCGDGRYVLPQADVLEIVQPDVEAVDSFSLRGQLLPLVHLDERLDVPSEVGRARRSVVVVRSNGTRFGIAVDAIDDTADLIVKPLGAALRSIPVFAGVAILADGAPSLVLDIAGLGTAVDATEHSATDGRVDFDEEATLSLLVVHDATGGRVAIPLAAVRRLEQLDTSSIDRSGAVAVARYLGAELPLIDVADGLRSDIVQVVVCESSIGLVGIAVHRIDDLMSLDADGEPAPLLDLEALVAGVGLGANA